MKLHADIVREGYAKIAPEYHARRLARERMNQAWLDGLRVQLPQEGGVVDLGCGAGVPISRYFADRGYEVDGYDISPEMLDIARVEVPKARFHCMPIEELSLESCSVDLVVSFFAFIHIERSLHLELFRRMTGWLRPGGAALLSLGADDNPLQQESDWHGAPMVWSHFDAATNLGLLCQAGFDIRWHEVEDLGDERHLFVIAGKR